MTQQAVGRVGLVVLACHLANLDNTVALLSQSLDVHDWEGPADLPLFGLRNAVSYDSGLEVVAPLDDQSALSAHLRDRGEGVYAVVFGVGNLAEAVRHATAHGLAPAPPLDGLPEAFVIDSLTANNGGPVYPSYPRRFAVHQETIMARVAGIHVILGQIEPVADRPLVAVEGTS
jgi:hypothetical protein